MLYGKSRLAYSSGFIVHGVLQLVFLTLMSTAVSLDKVVATEARIFVAEPVQKIRSTL